MGYQGYEDCFYCGGKGTLEEIDNGSIRANDDLKITSRTLIDKYEWDQHDAKKLWVFGPDQLGPNFLVDQTKAVGLGALLSLTALLSINVGVINLLPIPAFDGGHILFIIIELIKGSPVNPEIENKIHMVFLILLMLLMVVITFNDILRLFG